MSHLLDLSKPFGVVCHDAGAANIIISWLAHAGSSKAEVCFRGPAALLWERRFGGIAPSAPLEVQNLSTLLTGTGWSSDLEHEARRAAKARRVHSIAVLDHWVNYRERFIRAGEEVLPDEFWVTDGYAAAEAERCFHGSRISIKPNLYLDEEVSKTGPVPAAGEGDVLYVCEPIHSDWGRNAPGEFQALEYFLNLAAVLGIPPGTPIRLRPHPSDPPGKYDNWIQINGGQRVRLSQNNELCHDLTPARWVAGCDSFALVVALRSGRTTFSTLPPWAPDCRLPFAELIKVKDFARSVSSS